MAQTILIVDDIVYNRILITEIIESIGLQYASAGNGFEAIQLLKKQKVDAILLDIEMPVMNGFETAKYIRTELKNDNSNIPIIAITAHNYNLIKDNMKEMGFTDLLSKPYTYDKFVEVLSRCIPLQLDQ